MKTSVKVESVANNTIFAFHWVPLSLFVRHLFMLENFENFEKIQNFETPLSVGNYDTLTNKLT